MENAECSSPLRLTHILVDLVSAMQLQMINPLTVTSTTSLLRMIPIKVAHTFNLRHPECLIHTLDKMPRSPTPPHYPTLLKHPIDRTALLWHSAKEHPFAVIDIPVDDLGQHLCARTIDRSDAVDVEDDVFVVFGVSHARECGVGGGGAVEFESSEAVFEIAGIGEGEGLGYFDDETAVDEFEGLRVVFCVLELVFCAGYFTQDLYARFC